MSKRNGFFAIGAAAILAVGIGTYPFTASSEEGEHELGPRSMHMSRGMMGMMGGGMMRHGMMGMGRDSAAAADVGTIHELLAEHERIKRTVASLPNGIRTLTESDDPQIAQLIREHVTAMGKRVRDGNKLGLMETDTVHALYANKDKIRTTSEPTANGIAVTQTSDDPKVVALLQEHARDVSSLVAGGMAAMHTAMHSGALRGGMMGPMHEMMHGPMMQDRRGMN